jgi:hypothetical protein
MHRRQWLCVAVTAAVGTLGGGLTSMVAPDRWLLDTLAGHALCDVCLARRTRYALARLRGSVRRIAAVVAIDAVRPCERCGTVRRVYSLPRPSSA